MIKNQNFPEPSGIQNIQRENFIPTRKKKGLLLKRKIKIFWFFCLFFHFDFQMFYDEAVFVLTSSKIFFSIIEDIYSTSNIKVDINDENNLEETNFYNLMFNLCKISTKVPVKQVMLEHQFD